MFCKPFCLVLPNMTEILSSAHKIFLSYVAPKLAWVWQKVRSELGAFAGLATYSIFFCFLFVKTHWYAWISSVPPSNSLVSVSDSRRAFWADTAPFLGPRLALCVEIQGHHQVCRARCEGTRTPSTTADANLDCAFFENALFYIVLWFWKVNRIELN